jgi:hypothetical protein
LSGPLRALGLVAAWLLLACEEPPSAKIRGWPLTPADRALLAMPEADAGAQQEDASPPEPPPEPEEPPIIAPARGPCTRLLDLACELYGDYNDGCREARAKPPDESHPQTRDACAELLTRFQETELPRVGGACYRYTRSLCRVHGEGSERCRTARATIQLARSRREWRICLGDWLLLETRTFRR